MASSPSPSEAPDIETASAEYAKRFSGAVGEWFLKVQREATLKMLAPYPGASVLDVGGGHGQTAAPLIENGYDLTILGSTASCKRQIRDLVREGKCNFETGSMLDIPYESDRFDIVLSYRIIPHIENLDRFLSELARVSKSAVVVDYPDLRSFNYFKEYLFFLKDRVEEGTRKYRCFEMSSLLSRFEDLGMYYSDHYRQFFLPMFLHRTIGSVRVSMGAEKTFRSIGLTSVFGSPVILKVSSLN